jgi:hypothetical protein
MVMVDDAGWMMMDDEVESGQWTSAAGTDLINLLLD